MNSQTVRAVLAYGMTAMLFACVLLVTFANMTPTQMTMVGTLIGAIIANAKVPLAYFFDGVALEESEPIEPSPDAPAEVSGSIPAAKATPPTK
jgi:hypothetical protein